MARYPGRRLSHAVTMTGELADIFPDRPSGVRMISEQMRSLLGTAPLAIYAGPHGLLHERPSEPLLTAIASANWHASAVFVASRCRDGLLIDIGSTTSDIIPLQAGRPCFSGYSDAERLATQELVYSGIVRTPVMAVARRAPFAGTWQGLAAARVMLLLLLLPSLLLLVAVAGDHWCSSWPVEGDTRRTALLVT